MPRRIPEHAEPGFRAEGKRLHVHRKREMHVNAYDHNVMVYLSH